MIVEEDVDTDDMCGGCFRALFRKRPTTSHARGVSAEDEEGFLSRNSGESWAAKKLKEIKEMSEVVAGPKWKNFIRKIGGYFNGNNRRRRNMRRQDFQYDSFEYELNFDNEDDMDDQDRLRFSTKYAPPFNDHATRSTGVASS